MKAGLVSLETDLLLVRLLKEVIDSPLYMSTDGEENSSNLNKRAAPRSDTELLEAIRLGDNEAFREVVERYQRLLYSIAYGLMGDHSEADDVVQQVFIKFFEKAVRLHKPEALKTYLARSTTNECIDRLRRLKRRQTVSLEELGQDETLSLEDGRTPKEYVRRKELEKLIRWALSQLSWRQQRVMVLSYIEGLSYAEIAQVLNCEEVTVRTHLHRAKKRLEELLKSRLRDLEAGVNI